MNQHELTNLPEDTLVFRIERVRSRKAAEGQEPHYTPEELGGSWGLSANTIRRLFENEPVVRVKRPERMHKRGYETLRIPKSVAGSVHARLMREGK